MTTFGKRWVVSAMKKVQLSQKKRDMCKYFSSQIRIYNNHVIQMLILIITFHSNVFDHQLIHLNKTLRSRKYEENY